MRKLLYLISIVNIAISFIGCQQNSIKESSPILHYVEEYRNMYHNYLNDNDSLFFLAIIEERDDQSTLLLLGSNYIQFPIKCPPYDSSMCKSANPIDFDSLFLIEEQPIIEAYSPSSFEEEKEDSVRFLGYFTHKNNWVFVYSECNCEQCNALIEGLDLKDTSECDNGIRKRYNNGQATIDAQEWLFFNRNNHLKLVKVR